MMKGQTRREAGAESRGSHADGRAAKHRPKIILVHHILYRQFYRNYPDLN